MVAIKFFRLHEAARIPVYKTSGSAGADICSAEDTLIYPGQIVAVSTGFAVEIPEGFEMQIRPRSGLALNNGIGVLNSPGTIDSDYRGEIKVILHNFGTKVFDIDKGDRIAQAVVCAIPQVTFIEVSSVSNTERGAGGFGSTGQKG